MIDLSDDEYNILNSASFIISILVLILNLNIAVLDLTDFDYYHSHY